MNVIFENINHSSMYWKNFFGMKLHFIGSAKVFTTWGFCYPIQKSFAIFEQNDGFYTICCIKSDYF